MTSQVLMARQPIFNSNMKVVAYELLYRNSEGVNQIPLISGDQASSRVLLHSYTSVSEAGNLRVMPAFVNFTQQMLEQGTLPAMSPQEIVIEVLEDCLITPTLLDSVKRLADAGYTIALDDFEYTEAAVPLLDIARIVKLDIRAHSAEGLRQQVELIKPFNVRLLAEKVETHEEHQLCIELGFELFQGYFFSKPQLLKGTHTECNRAILLQLLASLNQPDVEMADIRALIERDPGLTYKLLRLVNSSAFGLQRKVSSIQETLVYLGLQELKKWLTLITLADHPSKPSELIRQLLLLARMSELIAIDEKLPSPGQAFMAGLLMHLDGLLDTPREQMLDEVHVSDEIHDAVMNGKGELGELIYRVEAFMQGEWSDEQDEVRMGRFNARYLESIAWTRESMRLMRQQSAS
ncbi:HDOD domain-containing protein [Marinobacterium sp. AK62]|uniref:HDOD domain-containing protein n=1 Tax=Marinobacterium alkalitolerans TaxID=1542925 RepID=A0ABS3ZCD0_9GAMM|nr:HDOD domain-containing protein [Marinobacterium alkalitolerans]MBP0049357.1 HDOD domain-containing protein [Marinobacterium alkalitolerans]